MTGALFSDFLMVDRPVASPATRPRRGRRATAHTAAADTSKATEQESRDAITQALAEALATALPHASGIELPALAAAVADIVAGRSVLLRLGSEVAGHRQAAVKTFLETLVRVAGTLDASRQEAAIVRLAEIILPDDLADARGALAADNLALRDRFIAQTACLTSADVGARAGHKSSNPYATAARWKKAGDVFSVQHRGTEYFPAFQFRDGRPHPTIKPVLAALPEALSPWQRAFWFVSTNGWLGDKAPAHWLGDPDAVLAAARHEAEEVIG